MSCARCGSALKPGAAFCSRCGASATRAARGLGHGLAFYFVLLAIQLGGLVYVRITSETTVAMIATSAGLAAAVLGYARLHWLELRSPWSRLGLGGRGLVAIVVGAPVICMLVFAYVEVLVDAFSIPRPDELAGLSGLAAVALAVVLAPLVEEVAFRGILLGSLRAALGRTEALVISSFAFALLHLSLPMLLTHVPLGLYFGWLRDRTGSLWPPVLAHACHNATALAIAAYG